MKKFFVYEIATGRVVKEFKYQKCAVKLMNNLGLDYSYALSRESIPAAVAMKKVRNLMTGEEIEIAADTPRCCDPSTETYWSM
jgi:hypothetical protein